MKDAPLISVSKGVLREAKEECNDRVTCERRNAPKKTTCRFPALPYMHLFRHCSFPRAGLCSPQTGVISMKITRRAVILGIWGISSLDLILSCSTHNFSWWLMQDRGRCYCLDPRQPEHFWRDSSKYRTYSEYATEFTGQRWHRLQVCDGKIRLKDKNESLGFSS